MTGHDHSKSKGKIVQFPSLFLPHIGTASVNGSGNRISGSRSDIWLCPAYGPDGQSLLLYVKIGLSDRAIMVEALAAQVAQAIGLRTSDPYIATVRPSFVGKSGSKNLIAFATLDLSTKAMARPVRNLGILFELLNKHKIADVACAFDEWVANDVRSPNDILVCPESGLYLIDHEAAMAENVMPDESITNWIAGQLIGSLSEKERLLLLQRIRGRLAAFRRVVFHDSPLLAVSYIQDGNAIYQRLVAFLIARLEHLEQLLSQRIFPEQLYLNAGSTSCSEGEKGQA